MRLPPHHSNIQEEIRASDMPLTSTKKGGGAGSGTSDRLSTPSPTGKGEFLWSEGNEAVKDGESGVSDFCSIREGLHSLAHVCASHSIDPGVPQATFKTRQPTTTTNFLPLISGNYCIHRHTSYALQMICRR